MSERLSNLSLGLAVLLSFVVVAVFISFYVTSNANRSDLSAQRDDYPVRKAINASPLINGS